MMPRGRPRTMDEYVESLERSTCRIEKLLLQLLERPPSTLIPLMVPQATYVANDEATGKAVNAPANPRTGNNNIEGVENPVILPAGNEIIADDNQQQLETDNAVCEEQFFVQYNRVIHQPDQHLHMVQGLDQVQQSSVLNRKEGDFVDDDVDIVQNHKGSVQDGVEEVRNLVKREDLNQEGYRNRSQDQDFRTYLNTDSKSQWFVESLREEEDAGDGYDRGFFLDPDPDVFVQLDPKLDPGPYADLEVRTLVTSPRSDLGLINPHLKWPNANSILEQKLGCLYDYQEKENWLNMAWKKNKTMLHLKVGLSPFLLKRVANHYLKLGSSFFLEGGNDGNYKS